jgi:hypothetical protein
MNPEDCAECKRILNRDGVAESCYQECYFCHHVNIINGKRVLRGSHDDYTPVEISKDKSKGVVEKIVDIDKKLA